MYRRDSEEIEKYFEEYYKALCFSCKARMPNHATYVEDIVNEVFVILCKKWHTLEKSDIRAWLYRVADNLLKEFFRKQAKETQKLDYIDDFADDNLIYEQNFENIDDDAIEIYKAEILSGLSEENKKLYDMNFVKNLSHEEIDKELRISEEALKKRLYRLKQKIKIEIDERVKRC